MTNEDLRDAIDRGFARMELRFDALNGRVRKNEQDVAVLQDRSDRAEVEMQQATAKHGTISAIVGAISGALTGFLKS